MTDAWDDDDRAIARALGADVPDGLDGDADADTDAIAEYESVLAHLPFDQVAPRSELEDQVVAAALARRPAAARAIEGKRSPARRPGSARWIAVGAAAAVAAAIVAVLIVGRPDAGPASPGARIAQASATNTAALVLQDPDARQGVLRTAGGANVGKVALGSDGQGVLYGLSESRSTGAQWLWLDTKAGPVRVGRVPEGATVNFVANGDLDAIAGVFVTTETASGAPTAPGSVNASATLSEG